MKKNKNAFFLISSLILFSCLPAFAYEKSREIKIIWDFDERQLYIFENGKLADNPWTFILTVDDRVILGLKSNEPDKTKFSIQCNLFPPKVPYELPGEIGGIVTPETVAKEGIKLSDKLSADVWLNVTDDLPSGGKLLATFKKVEKDEEKGRTHNLAFRIKYSYPLFILSTGVIVSNENNPTISIGTNNNGENIIIIKNSGNTNFYNLRPKQDLIQFFNFRIYEGLYLSFGCPLTLSKNIYENPHLGFVFYPGQNLAYMVHAGLAFHKETQILPSSGYRENQVVDSALKAESIPIEERYQIRFYVGISFRIK